MTNRIMICNQQCHSRIIVEHNSDQLIVGTFSSWSRRNTFPNAEKKKKTLTGVSLWVWGYRQLEMMGGNEKWGWKEEKQTGNRGAMIKNKSLTERDKRETKSWCRCCETPQKWKGAGVWKPAESAVGKQRERGDNRYRMNKKVARIPKVRTAWSRKEREIPGGRPTLLDAEKEDADRY